MKLNLNFEKYYIFHFISVFIRDMRDTHYIIFCHPKKTIVATQWKLLTEDYVMSNECRAYHE